MQLIHLDFNFNFFNNNYWFILIFLSSFLFFLNFLVWSVNNNNKNVKIGVFYSPSPEEHQCWQSSLNEGDILEAQDFCDDVLAQSWSKKPLRDWMHWRGKEEQF